MFELNVRKVRYFTEETYHEGGPVLTSPLKIVGVMVVLGNPYAGEFSDDLSTLRRGAREIADHVAPKLITLVGGSENVQTYGKGAIVGINGELEHGAVWHEAGGWALRSVLPKAKAVVPASKTVASAGFQLVVPLHHIEACYVRSHFTTIDVGMVDAPRPDELLYALVVGTGGRVHERLGGLRTEEISVGDGQR